MTVDRDVEASARRFMGRLPDLEVPGKRILDLRCGGGESCLVLARRGAREILGVDARDVSEALVKLERADPRIQRRVRFRQIVPDNWRPEDRRYDIILSRDALGPVATADAHLAQMKAALAPAGTIVIEFAPQRRAVAASRHEAMTLERFAQVMARSRLHCTWYRVEIAGCGFSRGGSLVRGAVRVALQTPIAPACPPATSVSVWRHPLYE